MTEFPLLLLIFLLAAFVTIWFYRGRRRNLYLISSFAKELEGAIKPIDQTYTWLGGYVGFRAEYKLPSPQPQINITLTLLPRHSLLSLPFSLLLLRHDRLYAILPWKTSVPGEAHLVRKGFLSIIPKIEGVERMVQEKWQSKGVEFDIWYKHSAAKDVIISIIQRLGNPGLIRHLALVPGPNHLYCFMKPQEGEIGKTLKTLMAIRQ